MYPRRGNSKIIQLSEDITVDVATFIDEVRKYPIVYDCRHDGYGDRRAKTKAWNEISAAMLQDWDNMSSLLKENMEKNLRGKWRHIRDYFTKELKARQLPITDANRKRNPYTYFKNLLFLLPAMEAKQGTTYRTCDADDYKTEEVMCDDTESLESNYGRVDGTVASFLDTSIVPVNGDPLCETSLGSYGNDMRDVSSHIVPKPMSNEEDYEKMFLLSLLPSLRQVPESMKLQVKIDMQQVLVAALRSNKSRSGS